MAWGPELALLYNDAYSPILGAKHPHALGRPFREVWAEIWNDLEPRVLNALAGEATSHENMHLVMDRRGFPEDTWYTSSYLPIRDESRTVAGIFCACFETSDKVQADQRAHFHIELSERLHGLSDAQAIALAAATALGRHLRVARAGYGEIDHAEQVVVVEQDWTRDSTVASLAGEARILDAFGPAVIADLHAGHTLVVEDSLNDPRILGDAYAATWAGIGCRSLIVTPLIRTGRFRAILYVHEGNAAPLEQHGGETGRAGCPNTLTADLADAIACVAQGAAVDRGLAHNATLRDTSIDSDVWCHAAFAQVCDEGGDVIGFVAPERDAPAALAAIQHSERRLPFCRAGRSG